LSRPPAHLPATAVCVGFQVLGTVIPDRERPAAIFSRCCQPGRPKIPYRSGIVVRNPRSPAQDHIGGRLRVRRHRSQQDARQWVV